jgi:hypothetical protein
MPTVNIAFLRGTVVDHSFEMLSKNEVNDLIVLTTLT